MFRYIGRHHLKNKSRVPTETAAKTDGRETQRSQISNDIRGLQIEITMRSSHIPI